ncbi:peptide ABC transporter ATP-binding protein [Thermococcus litoralis DSM 5473]|uniref:Peptide ABC transporter ATP-binding protein n=1 Tax=Thermococcus litoralis (strain ATCC 51850 / DSM 5473 / JCM 8560 / NS-C) TaxID=523849 RepID=H3ZPC8_THELN|nr:ABC transporter ATP-binding protein [Thermococcus litoralis]EHR78163.1 peptide ABC transporter ATP-binding protein [Thermococcus litoralis DSM 5473]
MIRVEHLKKYFAIKQGFLRKRTMWLKAVDDVSFEIKKGETFGLVGESGSGKSTLGRTILRLYEPTSGKVYFGETEITALPKEELKKIRPKMQMIYQDPYSSLNPRLTVFDIIAEPLKEHGYEHVRDRILELLEAVGLSEEHANKYPDELSGGQCQRVAIARALALDPEFIVLDEPTSALDVSVQAQVLNLLEDLKKDLRLTYLFISHDLGVVRYLADKVGVMYLGKIVESGDINQVFDHPKHPYTKMLLESIPIPDPKVRSIRRHKIVRGEIPSPLTPPSGCRFHPRCPYAKDICKKEEPEMIELERGHFVRCHFAEEM